MRYFVSYIYYENGQPLFGNAEWEGATITTLEHVQGIETELRNSIQEQDQKQVYVKLLFWQPFTDE